MSTDMHPDDIPDPIVLKHPSGNRTLPSPEENLSPAMGDIHERADLDRAKRAASLLTGEGMRELKAWLDSQLARRADC